MVPTEKIFSILERLLERSRRNQVNWQQAGDDADFRVRFPKSHLELASVGPTAEADGIVISIKKPSGRETFSTTVEKGDAHWQLACDLYKEAERAVFGWDEILFDIEEHLAGDGAVGLGEEPWENEIPF